MSISTITIGVTPVSVVAMPATPGLRSVQWGFEDTVGSVSYPFSGQTQTQEWVGADAWSGMLELPPLYQAEIDAWKAFLMELRGIKNGFFLGDPTKTTPSGTVGGGGTSNPQLISGNGAGSQTITTSGWLAGQANLLLPGDNIQIGYRLYSVLDAVTADSSGNATLRIWPSLRETFISTTPIVTDHPVGLFRRAQNKQNWSVDAESRMASLSFPIMEYR